MNNEDLSHVLYENRPDLWAISRVLKHCQRNTRTFVIRALVWENISKEDQQTLQDINAGKTPESFKAKAGAIS